MIKLIASDLDGTLLFGPEKKLPETVIPLIREYTKQGGIFVAASGRQYANLRNLFSEVKDEIAYICENGCRVIYHDEVLYHAKMERETGEDILHGIMEQENCELIVSGDETCYIQPKNKDFIDYMIHHVKNDTTVVEDIFAVQEPYFKISVFNPLGIEHSEDFFQEAYSDRVNVVTSGNAWLDMMPKGIHKGSGIQVLSDKLNIPLSEMMAIGDHYNDVEMLELVGYPACVASAKPEILEICTYKEALAENLIARAIRREM